MEGQIAEPPVGRLQGFRRGEGDAFLGIPYASAARFGPTLAPPTWAGTRDCATAGPAAPQPLRKMAQFSHGPLGDTSEDCLNLNVWRPADAEDLPVLVWIHGGGFTMGWGSAPTYEGHRLAQRTRTVVVTVNYRLGSLGWLWHPELAARSDGIGGNWGLLDQRAALRWVSKNISAFGGDPSNVTLAGQSAGASCVMAHLASPGSRGLFRRAILQSPLVDSSAGPPDYAVAWAEALAEAAGGSNGAGLDVEALLEPGADRIVELHEQLMKDPRFHGVSGAQPTLDLATIPVSPAADPTVSPQVDVLAGTTSEEARFFFFARQKSADEPLQEAALLGVLGHVPGLEDPQGLVESERKQALADGNRWGPDAFVRLATAEMFGRPLDRWASGRIAGGGTVYRYEVTHRGPLGALHTVEVPLIFGTFDDEPGPGARLAGDTAASASLSPTMMDAWGRFIHGADPGWDAGATHTFSD